MSEWASNSGQWVDIFNFFHACSENVKITSEGKKQWGRHFPVPNSNKIKKEELSPFLNVKRQPKQ